MRHYPEDKYDQEEIDRLKPKIWQLNLLKTNPSYTCWGPYEDYMGNENAGWESPIFCANWQEFGPWKLDDLNECVNFYFEINRDSKECEVCGGNGYHAEAQEIVNGFYDFEGQGTRWVDKITEDEYQALVDAGRHNIGNSAEETNDQNRPGVRGLGHDAINRWILIEQRLKRLGLKQKCDQCNGYGNIFIEDESHVSLVLWILHPRKGCSRGVEIKRVEKEDLPEVKAFLLEATERNAKRFSNVNSI